MFFGRGASYIINSHVALSVLSELRLHKLLWLTSFDVSDDHHAIGLRRDNIMRIQGGRILIVKLLLAKYIICQELDVLIRHSSDPVSERRFALFDDIVHVDVIPNRKLLLHLVGRRLGPWNVYDVKLICFVTSR